MELLNIRLFGGLDVRRGRTPLPPLPGAEPRNLFMFLLLEPGRFYHRDVLCGMLWGERPDDAARKALRNSLWRLRCALEPGAADGDGIVRAEGEQVGLVDERIRVDVQDFERATGPLGAGSAQDDLTDEAAAGLSRAVDLYRGDLLEGVYADWSLAPRERLRLTFLAALERLVRHHRERGEIQVAIARGQTLLRHDPLREHMHRELMELHWARGDRPSALREFSRCRRILREELDIEPMEETRALRDRIVAGAAAALPSIHRRARRPLPRAVARTVEGALAELYAAVDRLERLRDEEREEGSADV